MKTDLDDLPSYEGKRLVRNVAQKYRWNADVSRSRVERWLKSKVGEDFDNVFSEWTKLSWLPSRLRNLEYFKWFVETEVVFKDDQASFVFHFHRYGFIYPLSNSLYLDPNTKKIAFAEPLKKKSWKKAEAEKIAQRCIFLGDYHQLCKIDGIWYEIHLNPSVNVTIYDYSLKKLVYKTAITEKGKPYTDIDWKKGLLKSMKQLDSKTLRKYNLKND
jgi:hypothetical protein